MLLQRIQPEVTQLGVGVVDVVELVLTVVELEFRVEDGVVVVLNDVELDEENVEDETVPAPVPVDEVRVTVVTIVEELCDRVMMVDELQDAVEVTVEVSVKVSVLVNVWNTSEQASDHGCILLTVLILLRMSVVTFLQEQTLA